MLTLADELDVKLEAGKRKGMTKEDIQDMLTDVRTQIKELRPMWESANLKPYTFIQSGIYKYFNKEMAGYINEVLKVSNSQLLNIMQNSRGMAFSGDLSPILGVQTPLGILFDPLGSMKFATSELRKMSAEHDLFRTFTVDGLAREIQANPTKWREFFSYRPAPLGPEEFAWWFS